MPPFDMPYFPFYAAYLVLELLYAQAGLDINAEPMRQRVLVPQIDRNIQRLLQREIGFLHAEIENEGVQRLLDAFDHYPNRLPEWLPENIANRVERYLSPERLKEYLAVLNFHHEFRQQVSDREDDVIAILRHLVPVD